MSEDPAREKTIEWLVEQYKLYVEMADRVSARRVDASRLHVTLLTGLLAVTPFAIEASTPTDVGRVVFLVMGIVGIALCLVWMLNIRSYKQLNSLKFQVVREMEKSLPFPCYDREWQLLKDGTENIRYLRLTRIERYVPLLLMIPYLVLLVYAFLW